MTLLDLDDQGVAIVGPIDAGLSSLGLPDVGGGDYLTLVGVAVGVLLVGYAEGLGAAKTHAAKAGYDIDPRLSPRGQPCCSAFGSAQSRSTRAGTSGA